MTVRRSSSFTLLEDPHNGSACGEPPDILISPVCNELPDMAKTTAGRLTAAVIKVSLLGPWIEAANSEGLEICWCPAAKP